MPKVRSLCLLPLVSAEFNLIFNKKPNKSPPGLTTWRARDKKKGMPLLKKTDIAAAKSLQSYSLSLILGRALSIKNVRRLILGLL